MPSLKIVVSRLDRARLRPHLAGATAHGPAVSRLRDLLDRAVPVAPQRVPRGVVTMSSRVLVHDGRCGDAEVYVLAYPESDGARAVYVLSPLGAALLAAREGDRV